MIHAIDHVRMTGAPGAAGRMGAILGAPAGADGWIGLGNMRLWVTEGDAAVSGLGFAVADLDRARALFARRGVGSGEPADVDGRRMAALDTAATDGLALFLVERAGAVAGAGMGLDHVVIRTRNPDRALALFGGRLGLDLRLDRTNAAWGTRFLFFRCGASVVEVVRPLDDAATEGPNEFTGLAWRSATIEADHARLVADGVPVSDLKPGRKPGTRLFTIRDGAAVVPTIVIEQGRAD